MKNCCKNKKQIRVHEVLSNGQHLNLYFLKHDCIFGDNVTVWSMGLCISKTRRNSNDWFKGRKTQLHNRQTGTCGIEGLKKALNYIRQFVGEMGEYEELQIGWADEKRKRAYKFLLRYGFLEYDDCYYIRNPQYWERVKDAE